MSLPDAIVAASAILGAAHIAVWLIRLAHEDAMHRRAQMAADKTFYDLWQNTPGLGRQKPKTGN